MSAFEFEGHDALIAQLRAGTLDAPGHLHRRVLAGAPGRKRRLAAMSARRRFFVALPVAASLAVVVAVVQGTFLSSSSGPTPFNAAKREAHSALYPKLPALAGAAGATGPKGPTGAKGATGAEGATGLNGPTGAQGPTAANGANGADGPTSVYGFAQHGSARGPKGPSGPSGPPGPNGATGPTALQGQYSAYPYFSPAKERAVALPAALDQAAGKGVFTSPDALTIPTGRLVHAEATLVVSVPDHDALTQATNQATQIVTALGGYSQSVQYAASHKGYGQSFLDLRVPLGKTEVAIQKLGQLGELTQQSVATQDLEQQFHQQTSQIDQLRRAITIYKQALESGTLTGPQRVEVQIRLSNALHALKGTRTSRSQTVKAGRTAQIRLTLQTAQHAAAGPHKTGRLGQMLHNVGSFLAIEGIIVLYALIAALPIILLVALIWWLIRERRRREERLLAANA